MKKNIVILLVALPLLAGVLIGYGLRGKKTETTVVNGPTLTLTPKPNQQTSVFAITQSVSGYSVFNKALTETGLSEPLIANGPFTVFVPSNKAFISLSEEEIAELQKPESRTLLQRLVSYHIVSGAFPVNELVDGLTLLTVDGKELTITREGDNIEVNGVPLTKKNMQATNGVVHEIETLLTPPDEPVNEEIEEDIASPSSE